MNSKLNKMIEMLPFDEAFSGATKLSDSFISKLSGGTRYANSGCNNQACTDTNNSCENAGCGIKGNNSCSNLGCG